MFKYSSEKREDNSQAPVVQTKLSVNTPGDKYEQEADTMATRALQPNQESGGNNSSTLSAKISPVTQGPETTNAARVSPEVNSSLANTKGTGGNLEPGVGSAMSSKFGFDFGSVKIHTDEKAANMSRDLNARAFTVGNDIFFNRGMYNPGSGQGKQLLAHELTHVVQQNGINNHIQKDETADAAAAEAKKKSDLIARIKVSGIVAVNDGDANFTSGELSLVEQAIAGLPATDKTAIKGAQITRVSSLGGKTGGRYSNTQGIEGSTITNEQTIELSNNAFGGNIPAAESIRLVTHEIGHAIATMPLRVAKTDEIKAVLQSNTLVDEANVAVGEFNTANDTSNAAVEEYNNAVEVYNAAITGTDKDSITKARADMNAKKVAMDKLLAQRGAKEKIFKTKSDAVDAQKKVVETKAATSQSKIANIDDLKTDASSQVTLMETSYNASKAIIGKDDAESASYRAALTTVEEAIKTFYDENVTVDVEEKTADAAKSGVDAAIADRNSKRDALNKLNPKNTITGSTAALEAAQDGCFKAATVAAFNKSMNLSVRKFYDLVISNGISPALTTYAADNWPHKPEEFYAEAYSFFVTKPKDLEAYSKVLFDWFKAGSYK